MPSHDPVTLSPSPEHILTSFPSKKNSSEQVWVADVPNENATEPAGSYVITPLLIMVRVEQVMPAGKDCLTVYVSVGPR